MASGSGDGAQDSGIVWDCFIPSVESSCAASAIPAGWDKLTQANEVVSMAVKIRAYTARS
jgi:hypothetical protein